MTEKRLFQQAANMRLYVIFNSIPDSMEVILSNKNFKNHVIILFSKI